MLLRLRKIFLVITPIVLLIGLVFYISSKQEERYARELPGIVAKFYNCCDKYIQSDFKAIIILKNESFSAGSKDEIIANLIDSPSACGCHSLYKTNTGKLLLDINKQYRKSATKIDVGDSLLKKKGDQHLTVKNKGGQLFILEPLNNRYHMVCPNQTTSPPQEEPAPAVHPKQ
jgi:hypothetical protein